MRVDLGRRDWHPLFRCTVFGRHTACSFDTTSLVCMLDLISNFQLISTILGLARLYKWVAVLIIRLIQDKCVALDVCLRYRQLL